MYPEILRRIDYWAEKCDIPYDFLMEVAEGRKEEVIGWLKFDAEKFGYEYVEDENYIIDEILDTINNEVSNYLDFCGEENKA